MYIIQLKSGANIPFNNKSVSKFGGVPNLICAYILLEHQKKAKTSITIKEIIDLFPYTISNMAANG
jgi:hypothetical protein